MSSVPSALSCWKLLPANGKRVIRICCVLAPARRDLWGFGLFLEFNMTQLLAAVRTV